MLLVPHLQTFDRPRNSRIRTLSVEVYSILNNEEEVIAKKHSFSDTKFDILERKKIIVSHASNGTSHWQTGG